MAILHKLARLRYGLYLITHPVDGFWDLKHAGKGSFKAAMVIMLLYFFSTLVRRQLMSWYFREAYVYFLNVFTEFASQIGPFALWALACWCITSLLDGEGTMKDISKATAYSLVPMIFTNFIVVIISHLLTSREAMILDLITSIGLIWSLGLVFMSVVVTHQYTVLKSVVVTILSLLGMVVMVVLGLLVFFLVQQLIGFGMEIYTEVIIRLTE